MRGIYSLNKGYSSQESLEKLFQKISLMNRIKTKRFFSEIRQINRINQSISEKVVVFQERFPWGLIGGRSTRCSSFPSPPPLLDILCFFFRSLVPLLLLYPQIFCAELSPHLHSLPRLCLFSLPTMSSSFFSVSIIEK